MVEEGFEHDELCLRGFDFNLFDEEMEGCVGGDVKELPHLLIIMKLWPGDLKEQLHQMNKKVDEDKGGRGTQDNEIFQKLWQFPRR